MRLFFLCHTFVLISLVLCVRSSSHGNSGTQKSSGSPHKQEDKKMTSSYNKKSTSEKALGSFGYKPLNSKQSLGTLPRTSSGSEDDHGFSSDEDHQLYSSDNPNSPSLGSREYPLNTGSDSEGEDTTLKRSNHLPLDSNDPPPLEKVTSIEDTQASTNTIFETVWNQLRVMGDEGMIFRNLLQRVPGMKEFCNQHPRRHSAVLTKEKNDQVSSSSSEGIKTLYEKKFKEQQEQQKGTDGKTVLSKAHVPTVREIITENKRIRPPFGFPPIDAFNDRGVTILLPPARVLKQLVSGGDLSDYAIIALAKYHVVCGMLDPDQLDDKEDKTPVKIVVPTKLGLGDETNLSLSSESQIFPQVVLLEIQSLTGSGREKRLLDRILINRSLNVSQVIPCSNGFIWMLSGILDVPGQVPDELKSTTVVTSQLDLLRSAGVLKRIPTTNVSGHLKSRSWFSGMENSARKPSRSRNTKSDQKNVLTHRKNPSPGRSKTRSMDTGAKDISSYQPPLTIFVIKTQPWYELVSELTKESASMGSGADLRRVACLHASSSLIYSAQLREGPIPSMLIYDGDHRDNSSENSASRSRSYSDVSFTLNIMRDPTVPDRFLLNGHPILDMDYLFDGGVMHIIDGFISLPAPRSQLQLKYKSEEQRRKSSSSKSKREQSVTMEDRRKSETKLKKVEVVSDKIKEEVDDIANLTGHPAPEIFVDEEAEAMKEACSGCFNLKPIHSNSSKSIQSNVIKREAKQQVSTLPVFTTNSSSSSSLTGSISSLRKFSGNVKKAPTPLPVMFATARYEEDSGVERQSTK